MNSTVGKGNAEINKKRNEQNKFSSIISIVSACISFYVCIVLTWHEIRKRSERKQNSRNNNDKKYGYLMSWLSILGSYFTCIRMVASFFLVGSLYPHLAICRAVFEIYSWSMPIANMSVYGVLYVKQHLLYRSQSLKHLVNSKYLGICGMLAYLAYPVSMLIFMVLRFLYSTIGFRGERCGSIGIAISPKILTTIMLIGMVVSQLSLLALFLLPLVKHHMSTSATLRRKGKDMLKVMYRSTAITFFCVATDITLFGMSTFANKALFNIVGNLVNISFLFNSICIVFTFADWKQRLLPMLNCTNGSRGTDENHQRQKTGKDSSTLQSTASKAVALK